MDLPGRTPDKLPPVRAFTPIREKREAQSEKAFEQSDVGQRLAPLMLQVRSLERQVFEMKQFLAGFRGEEGIEVNGNVVVLNKRTVAAAAGTPWSAYAIEDGGLVQKTFLTQ